MQYLKRRIAFSRDEGSVSAAFRFKRFREFLQVLQVTSENSILDVGGSPDIWKGSGLEERVTILNVKLPNECMPPFHWARGDACSMNMFGDRSFDVVFSNSVIEHVGGLERQQQMANEIRRVGKKFWVQTPDKHFPIEVHFVFPFYQYFPHRVQIMIAKTWPLSYSKILDLDPIFEAEHIWLLRYHEMQALFPDAKIQREKFWGLTKSLIAVRA